ncbi:sulfurtransferase TusA family protein [Persephonella sp.]
MIKNGLYRDYLKDIQRFNELYDQFQKGEAFESDFKSFRLNNGIYGQRQQEFHMVRIKIPAGVLTPDQIREIANIGDQFSNGVAHITTRQDIQYHWIKLEDVPEIIKRINEIGLTTKDACGNTLRNITASYLSGVCPNEPFDVQKVAVKITENFLGKFEDLPRKFKIGFACCKEHSFLIPFNDIGLIPKINNGTPGFEVYIGGGLGDRPKYAHRYSDFLPLNELNLLLTAVMDLFNKHGDRKNKRHNRLKFLIEKIGFETFLKLLSEHIEKLKGIEEEFNCEITIREPEKINYKVPKTEDEGFNFWAESNLIPQRQENTYTAVIKLNLGNITTGKLRSIADISEKYSLTIKATHDQNIALLNIPEDILDTVYTELKLNSLDTPGSSSYLDITACPGSETCSLGITAARELSRAIYEKLPKDPETFRKLKHITIKVSGCPNSCAHHHVSSIGFHGIAMKIDDTLIPAYVLHLAGSGDVENPKIGHTILKIPAKNVPDVVEYLINLYLREGDGQRFEEFIEDYGIENLKKELEVFQKFSEGIEYNKDWGSDKEFSLEDLGTGECAGIIADKVETALKEGERLLKQAETHIQRGFKEDAEPHIKKAIEVIASGLLIPFGVKAEGKDAIDRFIEHIIGRKLMDEKYIYLITEDHLDVENYLKQSLEFYNDAKKTYLKLRRDTEQKKKEDKKEETARKEFLDLRGVECPFNYVKAKMKLKEMDTGSILIITIDGEESIRSVPQSIRDDGHEVIDIQEEGDNVYTVVVRKR